MKLTPIMFKIIRFLQELQKMGQDEADIKAIQYGAGIASSRETDLQLHYLEELHGMVARREVFIRGLYERKAKRADVWQLTPTGRAWTPDNVCSPASTVADLAQEIRAEQDGAGRGGGAAASTKPATRLDLTLGSDGMLEIVVRGTEFSILLTPGQTSQLGEFLTNTAGVWQCPF